MVYRIRYEQGKSRPEEAVVEANSPREAMVKFQSTCECDDCGAPRRVTSVQPEMAAQREW